MTNTNVSKNKLIMLVSGLLLAAVLAACTGGGGQPTSTPTAVEPTSPPAPPATAYPEPGGGNPYPYPYPYPPASQVLPAYPGPSQPYPGPLQPYPAPWQPQASDQSLQRGEAFVDKMDIVSMESFPPQFTLNLQGTLPTPCHELRVEVTAPDSQNQILVSVYSVVDPNAICTQVLAPFDASVPLQGQPSGKYTVLVNGKEAGSIEVP